MPDYPTSNVSNLKFQALWQNLKSCRAFCLERWTIESENKNFWVWITSKAKIAQSFLSVRNKQFSMWKSNSSSSTSMLESSSNGISIPSLSLSSAIREASFCSTRKYLKSNLLLSAETALRPQSHFKLPRIMIVFRWANWKKSSWMRTTNILRMKSRSWNSGRKSYRNISLTSKSRRRKLRRHRLDWDWKYPWRQTPKLKPTWCSWSAYSKQPAPTTREFENSCSKSPNCQLTMGRFINLWGRMWKN